MAEKVSSRPVPAKQFMASSPARLLAKRVILADLDKTLAISRHPIDEEMAGLINRLLGNRFFVIITGAQYSQIQKQLIGLVKNEGHLKRMYLFTGCGAELHMFRGGDWKQVYIEELNQAEKRRIHEVIDETLARIGYKHPETTYGKVVDERPTQVTFSALGQDAPAELRGNWDPTMEKRLTLKKHFDEALPDYKVAIGGGTSLDITKKWIDKAYGVRKAMETVGCGPEEMLFIGDALFEGGADYPVTTEGVDCVQVEDPEEGKMVLRHILDADVGK